MLKVIDIASQARMTSTEARLRMKTEKTTVNGSELKYSHRRSSTSSASPYAEILSETLPVNGSGCMSNQKSNSSKCGSDLESEYEKLLHVSVSGKIRRPPNAFILFARDYRKQVSQKHSNETNKSISTLLGRAWRSAPPKKKQNYYHLAKKLDRRHKHMYPMYSYKPKEARMLKKARLRMKTEKAAVNESELKHFHSRPSTSSENENGSDLEFEYKKLLHVSVSGKIRRPPNAFILFARDHRKQVSEEHPKESNRSISTHLGRVWRSTPPEKKQKYYHLAKKLSLRHKHMYPMYSYNPTEARMLKKTLLRMHIEKTAVNGSELKHSHCRLSTSNVSPYAEFLSETIPANGSGCMSNQKSNSSKSGSDLESEYEKLLLVSVSGKIRRPPNAFMLFARDRRKQVSEEHRNETNKSISILLGRAWRSSPPEKKQEYYHLAKKLSLRHKHMYPMYSYNPTEARMVKKTLLRMDIEKTAVNESELKHSHFRPSTSNVSPYAEFLSETIPANGSGCMPNQKSNSNENECDLESEYEKFLHVSVSGKIRRPPNAFMLFAHDHRKQVSQEHPKETNRSISTILGQAWRSAAPEKKLMYYHLAKKLDLRHKHMYPMYSYKPKEARMLKKTRLRMKNRKDWSK